MTDISLDIETLGTTPGSVILSIGAVAFDRSGAVGDYFYRNISIVSALSFGLTIDDETVEWWAHPDRMFALKKTMEDPRPLDEVLNSFGRWCRQSFEIDNVWAKPPQFDCGLVEAAYRAIKSAPPWEHRAPRCLRTLIDVSRFDAKSIPFEGIEHYALDDAFHQTHVTIAALKKLPS